MAAVLTTPQLNSSRAELEEEQQQPISLSGFE
ncbi:hypothetical protein K3495_g15122 [Podosphaera aphanis]|nr:hypothetical protein K3495_g15122 [Podosphaera aphanis]